LNDRNEIWNSHAVPGHTLRLRVRNKTAKINIKNKIGFAILKQQISKSYVPF